MEIPRCCSSAHPVRGGMARRLAALDGAGQLDRAAEQQQLFRERGLARVGMRDDGKRAPSRRFPAAGRSQSGISSDRPTCRSRLGRKCELQHDGVFAPIRGLVVPATNADLFEAEALIEPDGGQIARPHFEEGLLDARVAARSSRSSSSRRPKPTRAEFIPHADIEDMRLARPQAHDAVADDLPRQIERAAGVAHAQAVTKDVLAPRKRIAASVRWPRRRAGRFPSSAECATSGTSSQIFRRRGHQVLPPPAMRRMRGASELQVFPGLALVGRGAQ